MVLSLEQASVTNARSECSHSEKLLEKIETKTITVGVIGLGYVGYPLSLNFAESDARVIGFDIDVEKVNAINSGRGYIRHLDPERLSEIQSKHYFQATNDFSKISYCDAVIICVPTPLTKHLDPDLHFITETCKQISRYLKPGTIVSLESTTWPGTTEEVLLPLILDQNDLVLGEDFYVCFSPEREDPGNKEYATKNIPKLVGGMDEVSLEIGVRLYSLAIDKVIPVSHARIAEAAKLFENIFRSVNIALVNEMKVILEQMDIDVWEVIEASATKPFGFMPFWPGPGLGGHCIPIDPYYLSWKAKEHGITTKFIELAGEINRSMPQYVVTKVQDCLNTYGKAMNGARILILGLAYKSDIDDMRESPSLELIRIMEQKGAQVDYHDPYISKIGPNREYPELIGRSSVELTSNFDCFLIATTHSSFSKNKILSFEVPVVDTRNFLPKHKLVFKA